MSSEDDNSLDSIQEAMQSHNRLAGCSEDELFDELKRRSTAIVLLTLKPAADSEEASVLCNAFDGGVWQCLGMAQQFVHDMLNGKHGEEV